MKLLVMMEIFRQVEEKKLGLREPIEVKNKFFSIVDGSAYSLNKADDSDEDVYRRIGQKMTVLVANPHLLLSQRHRSVRQLITKRKPRHHLAVTTGPDEQHRLCRL